MKTRRTFILAFALVLMLSGCKKEEIAPIYPDYSPEKEVSDIIMTAEQLSEHRYRLFIENNSGKAVFIDSTFALYTEDGEPVPLVRDFLRNPDSKENQDSAEDTSIRKITYETPLSLRKPTNYSYIRSYPATLSLLYGRLKPGNYRIVKQLLDWDEFSETTPIDKYISAPITITETTSNCDYEAAFYEPPDMMWAGTSIEDLETSVSDITSTGLTLTLEHVGNTHWRPNTVNGRFFIYEDIDGEWLPVRFKQYPTAWGLAGSDEITSDAPLYH